MIEISLSAALILYSSLLGLLILVIWLYTEITTRRSFLILEQQDLWRCIFCGYTYLDQEAETVSKCPRCESYNSVSDKHAHMIAGHSDKASDVEETADTARNTSHRKRPHQRHRGPRHR